MESNLEFDESQLSLIALQSNQRLKNIIMFNPLHALQYNSVYPLASSYITLNAGKCNPVQLL